MRQCNRVRKWRKVRRDTSCASAGAGVKSKIWWEKKLASPSFLSSIGLRSFWLSRPLSHFLAYSALSLIQLSHPLSLFLLLFSALTSVSQKFLAASDPSLLSKLHQMCIIPNLIQAAISLSNTSLRPNWGFYTEQTLLNGLCSTKYMANTMIKFMIDLAETKKSSLLKTKIIGFSRKLLRVYNHFKNIWEQNCCQIDQYYYCITWRNLLNTLVMYKLGVKSHRPEAYLPQINFQVAKFTIE